MARALSDKLKAALGGTWIVDNRPGGSGQVGMPVVARSPADGYTLAVSPASSLTTDRSIFKSLQYDPESDFTPISRRVNRPMAPMVKDKQKYRTVAALLAAARAAPGQMSHASSGEGSPQHPAPRALSETSRKGPMTATHTSASSRLKAAAIRAAPARPDLLPG